MTTINQLRELLAKLDRGERVYLHQFVPVCEKALPELLDLIEAQHEALQGYVNGAYVKHPQISERGRKALTSYEKLKGKEDGR